MRRLGGRLRRAEARLRGWLWGLRPGVSVAAGVRIGRRCRLIVDPGSSVVLDAGCEVDDGTIVAAYAGGVVHLGPGAFVGRGSTIAAWVSVDVGEGTFLGELVSVRDHDHAVGHPPREGRVETTPVVIGADVWVGAKATVIRGTTIGTGSVVGANAVVRGDVPARTVVAGIPARVVRELEP